MQDTGCRMQDTGCRIQDARYRIQDARYRMQDAGCRMQDAGYRMQDAGYRMNKPRSYKDLEVYSLAKELAVKVHRMTIDDLPRFEMYEEGNQIRRSSKSIVSNIVEGFGRRRYKNEFIQFLTYAIASCDETKVHLEMLFETGSVKEVIFKELFHRYEELGAKLFNFRETVIRNHRVS